METGPTEVGLFPKAEKSTIAARNASDAPIDLPKRVRQKSALSLPSGTITDLI